MTTRLKRCTVEGCHSLIPLNAVACSKHICQDCGEEPTYSYKAIRCDACHKKAKGDQRGNTPYISKKPHKSESQKHPCHCEKMMVPRTNKYCDECRPDKNEVWRNYAKASFMGEQYPQIEQIEPWVPKPKPKPIMTNAEQIAHDMAVEVKLAKRCGYGHGPVRKLSRDEIRKLQGQITPIDQIPGRHYVGNEPIAYMT